MQRDAKARKHSRGPWWATFVAVMAVLAIAGNCTSDDGTASSGDAVTSDSECAPADQATVDVIASGLTVAGGGELTNAQSVSIDGYDSAAEIVAAEITGEGMSGAVGVWSVGPSASGPIVALNAMAREFSEWGAAASDGSPMDGLTSELASSDEAATAKGCV